ncbi:aspartate aminotransferase-like enzyme [Kitasatospora sp. MAA4]|uniref:pyridoxal-phosphate-dependent aminotransferase family protein n=1 Tax=Kitasatospora sp. MAA4 TaxID=3035093 RepID=UPI0024751917|nr:alanine--glyoxylate aminotransferase family protein [Kitasatospora sp. MAA4]MDH6136208.1 aspartate aminotransferase-like enzyme [Kitasatospora sp. MAA4]
MTAKYRLMVPGPTPMSPEVTAAAVRPLVDERTPEYSAVFTRILDNLRQVLLTENTVLLFTSSMTGAFEGAVQNLLSPGDHVLVATNGVYGERWVELCRAFGLRVTEVSAPWGQAVDMAEVGRALAEHSDITAAIAVHCETSTGVVNDIRAFARVAAGVLTIVDSASGLGACELRTDEWGLDVVVAGGQKALMTPPGVAFASVSGRAWQYHEKATLPRFYFDWTQTREAHERDVAHTPWTPAITLLNQLDAALVQLLDEGLERVLRRHVRLGRMTRAGVRAMGLEIFGSNDDRAASVTAVRVPAELDGEALIRRIFTEHGVQLVGGPGLLAGQVLRIGHCGYVDAFDVLSALAALELSLAATGYPVAVGEGVAAALRSFHEGQA